MNSALATGAEDITWLTGIDVCEHHRMDFDEVRRQGTEVVIVRAGRGTRHDSRWIEHVRAVEHADLALGSYWFLYASRTTAHHQAELWAAAISVAPSLFPAGHWLHVATDDGLAGHTFTRYVDACLHRMDELLGRPVGVCTDRSFWQQRVRVPWCGRPVWDCPVGDATTATTAGNAAAVEPALAVRARPSDRGGPGMHLIRADALRLAPPSAQGLHLVARGAEESVSSWQRRWLRAPDVAVLQRHLNELGATVEVDGIYGPATDAAVHVWHDLCRRDLVGHPSWPSRPADLPTTDRTAHR